MRSAAPFSLAAGMSTERSTLAVDVDCADAGALMRAHARVQATVQVSAEMMRMCRVIMMQDSY